MDLAFDSLLLRSICENEEVAASELGPKVAEILKHRLADLLAATTINDIVVGNPRLITNEDGQQQMGFDLIDSYQIVLSANHKRNPLDKDGKIDWQKVSRVKIVQIERNLC